MKTVALPPAGGQPLASSSSPSSTSSPSASIPPDEVSEPRGGGSSLLALRADGAVLLSIEELGDRDLAGYSIWTAVVLPAEQAALTRERAESAAHEAAAKLAKTFPKRRLDS